MQDFVVKARALWTPEREAKVTGGRQWLIRPSEAPLLLRTLGLLAGDGSMPADALRKVSQVNHMIALLRPALLELVARHEVVRVIDAGCGTSPLSLILGWYITEKLGRQAAIIGIDADPRVIATSEKRAAALGLAGVLRLRVGSIGEGEPELLFAEMFPERGAALAAAGKKARPHLLLALHACDTATDQALAVGIKSGADVMAVAPCCHGELARQWKELREPQAALYPVFQTPNLRREMAAQATDALRVLLTRSVGYEVTPTEFVPSVHTPKNRLLLCVRRGRYHDEAREQYERMKGVFGGGVIALERLLEGVDGGQREARRAGARVKAETEAEAAREREHGA